MSPRGPSLLSVREGGGDTGARPLESDTSRFDAASGSTPVGN